METPSSLEDLTPEWVTFALAQGGHIADGKVVSLEIQPIGEGVGFLSSVAKCMLEYDRPECGPASLVVKHELSAGSFHDLSDEVHAFDREILFYRDVARSAPIRLPVCYYADSTPPNRVLVMEDLSFAETCDQVVGLDELRVVDIARVIGRLQGRYWNNEALAELTWMPTSNRRFWGLFDSLWDGFVSKFEGTLSDSARELGQRLVGKGDWLEEQVNGRPSTLVHSDLRADNILIDGTGPDSVLILDWQLAVRSLGTFDITRLMGGSEITSERRGHQRDVLRAWFDGVHESDVAYGWDEAVYDMRLGGLLMACWALQFYDAVDGTPGRPHELVIRVCERAFDSAVEMEAIGILPVD